ncbi:carboxyltransferase subunit alpha [Amycolatopsis sp. NPDC054798]
MGTPVVAATAEWVLCPRCRAAVFASRLERELRVCPDCGEHLRMTAGQRLAALFDEGSARSLDADLGDPDPLEFHDTMPYPQRRSAAREATGLSEAVLCASGTIDGHPVVAAVMDFRFLGGSLGCAVGELVTRAGETALRRRTPLLIVSASGGARMQEGAWSLLQMAKTSQMLGQLDAAGIPVLSLVTDPTFGGVAASYATLADIIVAEPGARLGFAGPRVIEQTMKQPLPARFQTAEALLDKGFVDIRCPRGELRALLGRLLGLLRAPDLTVLSRESPTVTEPEGLPERDPWQAVQQAREISRPTALDYAGLAFDDFVELHGDRLGKDCPALIGGLARIGSVSLVLLGTQKGHTAAELAGRNFGMASPAGYRKAARLMRLAAKLRLPVVSLIDTPGAYPGVEAEQHGQAFAIAENLRLMAGLPVPTVAVVLGEGGSGGALALAVADRVLMCSGAVYSVISPEGCAAILWRDAAAAPEAARALRMDARQLLRMGLVDGVIPEPEGGAQADHLAAANRLRDAVAAALAELPAAELLERRHRRFRRIGAPDPARA